MAHDKNAVMNKPAPQKSESSPQRSDSGHVSDDAVTSQAIESALLGLWEVVNDLTMIPAPRRERYRVTIFGSARLKPNSSLYIDVQDLASKLTAMGCDIVTGGGPGLMQAANEGSVIADPADLTQSIGVRIDLGFEQFANPFVEEVYQHRTFFSRLHHFVLLSDAFVVVPGGIGTTLEAFMIWQLIQVRKLHDKPLIMVGNMWADLVAWANKNMVEGDLLMADPEDMEIPKCVDSFADAIALIRDSHRQWQGSDQSRDEA